MAKYPTLESNGVGSPLMRPSEATSASQWFAPTSDGKELWVPGELSGEEIGEHL